MSNNNISFILHKPQLSENIGACARAMKNFNFQKMIVIDPKPIYPNDKILATSVGAKNIISKSKNFDNLEDAIKKIFVMVKKDKFANRTILFSPSAASFDSFKNFEDRGLYFNKLIKKYFNGK